MPAYTNPNPLMRFLFWERVKAAMGYVTENSRSNICLDFGCGLGVMIPFLRNYADSIIAFDLDNELLKIIGNQQKWDNVTYSTELDDLNKYEGKVDLILAMDVLEHVDNLDEVLINFSKLLSPTGSIFLTGPTENLFYKIGRKFANYSGHYHLRNIYDIFAKMEDYFELINIRTLPATVLPLFEIGYAKIRTSS